MGVIRGGLLVIVSIIFFVFILFTNSLITVYSSLDHNNVKNNLGVVIQDYAKDQNSSLELLNDQDLSNMKKYCENSSYVLKENITNFGIKINISCESINQGKEAIIGEFINETVDQVYYRDYQCSISDCLKDKNTAFYLVSEKFHNYLSGKVYVLLLVSLILFGLILLLTEHRSNAFIIAGILLIIASLPFMKLESIATSLSGDSFSQIAKVFFANSYSVFIASLVLGILFLVVGIVIKLFSVGFKVSEFFNKSKKEEITDEKVSEIVKEEVTKQNAQKTKEVKESKDKSRQSSVDTKKAKNN